MYALSTIPSQSILYPHPRPYAVSVARPTILPPRSPTSTVLDSEDEGPVRQRVQDQARESNESDTETTEQRTDTEEPEEPEEPEDLGYVQEMQEERDARADHSHHHDHQEEPQNVEDPPISVNDPRTASDLCRRLNESPIEYSLVSGKEIGFSLRAMFPDLPRDGTVHAGVYILVPDIIGDYIWFNIYNTDPDQDRSRALDYGYSDPNCIWEVDFDASMFEYMIQCVQDDRMMYTTNYDVRNLNDDRSNTGRSYWIRTDVRTTRMSHMFLRRTLPNAPSASQETAHILLQLRNAFMHDLYESLTDTMKHHLRTRWLHYSN